MPQRTGGAMKIVVDHLLCDGNAVCVREAPMVFALDDEDRVQVEADKVRAHLDAVRHAVQRCPKGALRLDES